MSADNEKIWYFAFGSNMNTKILTGSRNVRPTQSKPSYLPGWYLNFDTDGIPFYEPSYASIGKKPIFPSQPEVHGVTHEITRKEYDRIRWTELGGCFEDVGYANVEIIVNTYDGELLKSYTLIERTRKLYHGQLYSSKRYMELLEGGSIEFRLKPHYQEWLKTLPRYDESSIHTMRHAMGLKIFLGLAFLWWVPLMLPFWLHKWTGSLESPKWTFVISKWVTIAMCHIYYFIFLPIFGPGAGEPISTKKLKSTN